MSSHSIRPLILLDGEVILYLYSAKSFREMHDKGMPVKRKNDRPVAAARTILRCGTNGDWMFVEHELHL